MSPQPSAAQARHAAENGEKLLAAKKLEIEAYQTFQRDAPIALEILPGLDYAPNLDLLHALQKATQQFFLSKIARAEVELEELGLQVKMYRAMELQAGSMIQVPGIKPR